MLSPDRTLDVLSGHVEGTLMEVRRATVGRCRRRSRADWRRWPTRAAGWPRPAGTDAADSLVDRFTAAAIEEGSRCCSRSKTTGRLVGCLGLHPARADGVLDLGMWLLAPARGRGRRAGAGPRRAGPRADHRRPQGRARGLPRQRPRHLPLFGLRLRDRGRAAQPLPSSRTARCARR
ncbi:MAG: hypothetical protein WKF40_07670 [Thermoleophilaceae bacterium]